MTEAQVAFLCRAAASLPLAKESKQSNLLRSYYLMRCQDLTHGYGLPEKQFSSKVRCQRCNTSWKNGCITKIKQVKLSKKQRRRIRKQTDTKKNSQEHKQKLDLLHGNEVEQVCLFCKNSTIINSKKPEKVKQLQQEASATNESKKNKSDIKLSQTEHRNQQQPSVAKESKKNIDDSKKLQTKPRNQEKTILGQGVKKKGSKEVKKLEINVYNTARTIFSLKDKNNTVASAVKEAPKIINNNKKKKDKFAGLCQKAVLTSMKLKEDKQKQNKLNMFLKPSSENK